MFIIQLLGLFNWWTLDTMSGCQTTEGPAIATSMTKTKMEAGLKRRDGTLAGIQWVCMINRLSSKKFLKKRALRS